MSDQTSTHVDTNRMDNAKPLYMWFSAFALVVFGVFLFVRHYVQDYSDPVSFVARAMAWGRGEDAASRAPLYPPILYYIMQITGRNWVFISNLPFVLLMTGLLGWMTLKQFDHKKNGMAFFAALAGMTAITIAITVRYDVMQNLVNPFREPLAFSVMIACIIMLITGWRGNKGGLLMLLSGLALGITTSIRETGIILALPIGLWLLVEMVKTRKIRLVLLILFGLGVVGGMLPLLKQNYEATGKALVPSYAAKEIESLETRPAWDIPVPGMSLKNFRGTAPETIRRTVDAFHFYWVFFFAAGLLFAIQRRNTVILALFFPAFLLYLFFYFFYWYYKTRYLLSAEIFAIPIMGYGLACSVQWLEQQISRYRPTLVAYVRAGMVMLLGTVILSTLLPRFLEADNRTKVWHLDPVREQIMKHLDLPAVFFGHRHFCFRMAWLLGQESFEYGREFSFDYTAYTSLDERLRGYGHKTHEIFSTGNYYINDPNYPWIQNWLELTPVFSLSDLTVPLDHYGKQESSTIYKAGLWKSTNTTLAINRVTSTPAVLMLDMKRIWDYPGRTFCTGRETMSGLTYPLSNEVHFIELRGVSSRGLSDFMIRSDQPIPANPYWRLINRNDEINLTLGMSGSYWIRNFLSDSLFPNPKIPGDAAHLYDHGSMLLPNYADTSRDVFAELRFEFFQEHPFWWNEAYRLKIESGEQHLDLLLPQRRSLGFATVHLGRGAGELKMVPFDMETNLPSRDRQNSWEIWQHCNRNAFVKITGVRIFSLPASVDLPIRVEVGADDDGPYILSGFHMREKIGTRTARWTEGQASVNVRVPNVNVPVVLRWHTIPSRPDAASLTPVFKINDHELPASEIRQLSGEEKLVYEMTIAPDLFVPGEWNAFSVAVQTFSPAVELNSPDQRNLGIYVSRLELDRALP